MLGVKDAGTQAVFQGEAFVPSTLLPLALFPS